MLMETNILQKRIVQKINSNHHPTSRNGNQLSSTNNHYRSNYLEP